MKQLFIYQFFCQALVRNLVLLKEFRVKLFPGSVFVLVLQLQQNFIPDRFKG
jgi:hypothetical protein